MWLSLPILPDDERNRGASVASSCHRAQQICGHGPPIRLQLRHRFRLQAGGWSASCSSQLEGRNWSLPPPFRATPRAAETTALRRTRQANAQATPAPSCQRRGMSAGAVRLWLSPKDYHRRSGNFSAAVALDLERPASSPRRETWFAESFPDSQRTLLCKASALGQSFSPS